MEINFHDTPGRSEEVVSGRTKRLKTVGGTRVYVGHMGIER